MIKAILTLDVDKWKKLRTPKNFNNTYQLKKMRNKRLAKHDR